MCIPTRYITFIYLYHTYTNILVYIRYIRLRQGTTLLRHIHLIYICTYYILLFIQYIHFIQYSYLYTSSSLMLTIRYNNI